MLSIRSGRAPVCTLVKKLKMLICNSPHRILLTFWGFVVRLAECIERHRRRKSHNFSFFINSIGKCALVRPNEESVPKKAKKKTFIGYEFANF